MVELKECKRDCFCKDCDDKECLHAGKAEADCPRYICIFPSYSKEFLDCENCLWLKGWYAEMKEQALEEGVKND